MLYIKFFYLDATLEIGKNHSSRNRSVVNRVRDGLAVNGSVS